jgi:hypothetical protein
MRYNKRCGCLVQEMEEWSDGSGNAHKHIPYNTRCKFHKLQLDIISDYEDWKTGFVEGGRMWWTRRWIKHQLFGKPKE